ncbi:MAG: hypothetical protein WA655_07750 [Candidatus Korobacteraceae bacterium]
MPKKKPLTAAELQSMGGTARAAALSKAERTEIARKAGKARAASLSPAERSQIAQKAVAAREAKRRTTKKKGGAK